MCDGSYILHFAAQPTAPVVPSFFEVSGTQVLHVLFPLPSRGLDSLCDSCYGAQYQGREEANSVRVKEHVEGRYEAQEVPFGIVYTWRPGRVVIECDCGERLTLTGTTGICACGTDLTAILRETLAARRSSDEHLHPWRCGEDREDAKCLTERAFFDEID